jgi:peptide/nickel transport system permease protein
MMALIGLLSWTGYARFIRGEFFKLRNQDFVHAARAAGLPLRSIIFRHMLPNGITPVLVNTSFGVASAILIESTLSFLGLGLVDEPSWGQLLNQARAGGTGFQWWIATFPGLAIFLTVFAYNLIGEAIRDAIDPRLRKRD